MSFQFNSTTLADLSVVGVYGRRGLGFAQLRFSVKFTFSTFTPRDVLIHDIRLRVDVSKSNGSSAVFLGIADTESAWSFKTSEYSQQETNIFDLNLSEGQLAILEEFRDGHGLRFSLTASAFADRSQERVMQQDQIHRDVSLSDWVSILKELGGPEYFVVAIPIPTAKDDALNTAMQKIKKAHGELLNGNYETCVADCRIALESARKVAPTEAARGVPAVRRYMDGKMSMTKLERELLLEEAGMHYCHLALHASTDGTVEVFSRDDAQMILSIASTVIGATRRRL